jgi:sterol desaturase/sphingolipid hydroxylase (fatty acid hydroxylase superfamily)
VKKNISRLLRLPSMPTILLMILGFIVIFVFQSFQSELIKISKSDTQFDDGSISGTFQHFLISLRDWYRALPVYSRELIWSLHTKYLYFIVPLILLIEYYVPCRPEQPLFSVGFFQDTIWFVLRLLLDPLLIGAFFIVLKTVYDDYLSFLTIQTALSWPLPLQILFVILVSDFLVWLSHVVVHKVSSLWAFHAVHHSQEQMNMFTGDRAHPVDILFQQVITCIPLLIFQIPVLPSLPIIWVSKGLWQRLIHANVKVDLGIFNYILVSPQFHRIHHSNESCHRDKNFGSFFSIWDHLFGTAYRCTSEYPTTGITDTAFPYEGRAKKSGLLVNVCLQLIYPFEQLLRYRIKRTSHMIRGLKSSIN